MRARVPGPYQVHVLLSAGILCFSEHKFDLVRAGLMLYGSSPVPERATISAAGNGLEVARRAPARPAGGSEPELWPDVYHFAADEGRHDQRRLRRWLSGVRFPIATAAVLIGGRRCPVLGRVTMDLTMVDVSAVPGVKPGDEVVLIGKQGSGGNFRRGSGRARRDDRMGDFYRHWQPGAAGVSLIRELRFEIR